MNAPRGFYRLAVDRPVGLFVAFLTLLVVGVIAYVRIPLEMMPSGLSSNELYVWISHPGASAQENEREVVRPIEDQIRTLSGIAHVYSNAESDEAGIEVVYDSGVDMALAKAELRDRLERVRPTLPDTVNRIFVWSWSQSELPLMWFAVTYDSQGPDTDYLVDTVVQRRLEAVDGVTRVQIYGMLDDAIEVRLDEEKVKASRLDVGELIGRLARDNFTQPLGQVDDGGQRVLLRSDMRFKDLEEVEDFPIGNGQRISDVGRVVRSKGVRDRLSRINGRFAYFGEIRRENQANVVDVSHRVKQALDELERDPATRGKLAFHVLFAQGDFIESSLSQLRSTALWGGALAAAVLLLFLRRVRVTLVVALSIPVSALLSLAYVYYTGGSFNILTMTGITLGIGMLVDNSVVVIENIVRLHNEGLDARFAASTGVRDVGLAVSLATLTTVVVFLPLIFMTSNPQMRIMFGSLGLPLCASLLFSLMVALVFLPVVTARIIGPRAAAASKLAGALAPIARVPVRSVTWLLDGLRHPLHLALCAAHHVERAALRVLAPLRWPLAAGLVAFAVWRAVQWSGAAAALGEYPGAKAFGEQSKGVAGTVVFAALVGAGVLVVGVPRWRRAALAPPVRSADSLAGIDSFVDLLIASNRALLSWTLLHRIQASALATLAVFSVAIPMSKLEIAAFGEDESRARMEVHVELEDNFTLREASEEFRRYEHLFDEHKDDWGFEDHSVRFDDDSGRFTLYWAQALKSDEYDRVRRDLMAVWPTVPGHTTRFYGDESIDTRSKTMVTFRLQGPEPDELERLGLEAMDLLATVDGLTDLTSPLQGTPPQVRVKLDSEQAWSLGVTADIALQNIAWALRGFALPRYHEPGREIPFFIGYDEEQTAGLDTLRNLEIYTQSGAPALGSFAALEFGQGQQSIRRVDGQISFSIQGRVEEASRQREVSETGLALLRGMEFPRGFSVAEDESVENRQAKEMEELKMAMRLSVVLVFLLMGILFESVLLPFSVLFTIPFAIVGALWTLLLTGTVLDSIGWIGVIILIGVVVNNGIVLIDRIHRLRLEGVERAEAVVEGSASRVRPILMTAMTTIFGLLPMTVAEPPSDGIDYRALATCVAGGLAFSTFFTLWVVPLAYTLMDDLGHALARHRSWVLGTVGSRRTTSTKPVEST
ncbi:MAG: efflux RND transporter permease subunit [Planctomycetes bacterium]|nr:efflux RND transporter permease subunit [Planctomycetota bacterium]